MRLTSILSISLGNKICIRHLMIDRLFSFAEYFNISLSLRPGIDFYYGFQFESFCFENKEMKWKKWKKFSAYFKTHDEIVTRPGEVRGLLCRHCNNFVLTFILYYCIMHLQLKIKSSKISELRNLQLFVTFILFTADRFVKVLI